MPLRSPLSATTSSVSLYLMILAWITLIQPVFAGALGFESVHNNIARQAEPPSPPTNTTESQLLCTPFGACEQCPPDAMNEPFCQPFGNRRLMHCINTTFTPSPPPPSAESNLQNAVGPSQKLTTLQPSGGQIPAWESCGRIVAKERADFYEFVACNVVFALIALGVLVFRSRRMQVNQARQLAARIGLIRSEGGRILRP